MFLIWLVMPWPATGQQPEIARCKPTIGGDAGSSFARRSSLGQRGKRLVAGDDAINDEVDNEEES
jgi:hypothetical protein